MSLNVPLPAGYTGLDDLPKQREMLINLVNLGGSLVRTPGIEYVDYSTDTSYGCRGAANWGVNGNAYFVVNQRLLIVYPDGTYFMNSDPGYDIPFSARCHLAAGQTHMVILVEGGPAFAITPGSSLPIQITSANYKASISVDYIDGRFVFVPADGSPAIYTEIDDPYTINALSFFDAEELPDANRYVINVRNLLFMMGESTTEVFTSTGDANAPFSRRSGSRIDYGYTAGALRHKNTFAFIGQQRDQSYGVYLMGSGDVVPIHNEAVIEDLNTHSQADINGAIANRFNWYGKEFLTWTIGNRTYCFCEGNWLFLDSELNGTESGPWQVSGVAFVGGKYYVGSRTCNRFGYLADVPYEYGDDVEYQFDTFLRTERGSYMRPGAIELDVLTGQNAKTLGISLSRDGRVKGDYFYRALGNTGQYQRRMVWQPPGGLGEFESFMGISVRGTGQVQFSAEALYVR